jgi:hypothetical protein
MIDVRALREEFIAARQQALAQARWSADDPKVPPDVCRYCGRHWQRRAGSRLDGHAACIVPEDFKQRVGDLLRPAPMTYAVIADALDVTPNIVRSWAFSAGVVGPTTHKLRNYNRSSARRTR